MINFLSSAGRSFRRPPCLPLQLWHEEVHRGGAVIPALHHNRQKALWSGLFWPRVWLPWAPRGVNSQCKYAYAYAAFTNPKRLQIYLQLSVDGKINHKKSNFANFAITSSWWSGLPEHLQLCASRGAGIRSCPVEVAEGLEGGGGGHGAGRWWASFQPPKAGAIDRPCANSDRRTVTGVTGGDGDIWSQKTLVNTRLETISERKIKE